MTWTQLKRQLNICILDAFICSYLWLSTPWRWYCVVCWFSCTAGGKLDACCVQNISDAAFHLLRIKAQNLNLLKHFAALQALVFLSGDANLVRFDSALWLSFFFPSMCNKLIDWLVDRMIALHLSLSCSGNLSPSLFTFKTSGEWISNVSNLSVV